MDRDGARHSHRMPPRPTISDEWVGYGVRGRFAEYSWRFLFGYGLQQVTLNEEIVLLEHGLDLLVARIELSE